MKISENLCNSWLKKECYSPLFNEGGVIKNNKY